MNRAPTIEFLGGAGTVTGSKYLVNCGGKNILVDCGLFQGVKELRLKNWEAFPISPKKIDCVLLTHAHLDHTGYLPVLVKNGYRGKVYCTSPTLELTQILLNDSAKIQELDAEYANRKGFSKHKPALALYGVEDAEFAEERLEPVSPRKWIEVLPGIRCRFSPSSHILGSAIIELEYNEKIVVFSGDLGRQRPLLFSPPDPIERADTLVIESTYGDRNHPEDSTAESLAKIVNQTVAKKGHLLIASFAVGRAQDVMYLLSILKKRGAIPDVPVYLDSPMAEDVTEIYSRHANWHNLSPNEVRDLCSVAKIIKTTQESKKLLHLNHSSIVISASGMLSGGRVLFHLENRLADERNTILLVGYQAAGTRGRLLKDGAQEIKMHGKYIPVKARIEELTNLSAHADQREILTWLKQIKIPPRLTFITHGEPQAADALRVRITDELGWVSKIPKLGEQCSLLMSHLA